MAERLTDRPLRKLGLPGEALDPEEDRGAVVRRAVRHGQQDGLVGLRERPDLATLFLILEGAYLGLVDQGHQLDAHGAASNPPTTCRRRRRTISARLGS